MTKAQRLRLHCGHTSTRPSGSTFCWLHWPPASSSSFYACACCAQSENSTPSLQSATRIAREVHDTLAQGYVGVSVQLEVLSELLRHNNAEAAIKHLDTARQHVREGLAEARQSIWALRSQDTGENTLPVKLRRATELANGNGIEATFSLYGAYRPMPPGDGTRIPARRTGSHP